MPQQTLQKEKTKGREVYMIQSKDLLEARKQELIILKSQREQALQSAPKGTLHIHTQKNKKTQYYHKCTSDQKPQYIKEKDYYIAEALAQKEYNQKIICAAADELEAIKKYEKSFPELTAEEIYENLTEERKKLINPMILPEKQFIEEWESVKYTGRSFDKDAPEHYTSKGERVRSKSEVIIADSLRRAGIPYRYEFPIELYYGKVVYPDFTILNVRLRKEIRWEHFGMMNKEDYVEKTVRKINDYEMSGLYSGEHMIYTFETMESPLNQKIINLMIQRYLL